MSARIQPFDSAIAGDHAAAARTQVHRHDPRDLHRSGAWAWMVTGYAEVRRLLGDERLGRSHPGPENASHTGKSALYGGPMGDSDTAQAEHARMRSLLQPHFSPRLMRALRSRVKALTVALLDEPVLVGGAAGEILRAPRGDGGGFPATPAPAWTSVAPPSTKEIGPAARRRGPPRRSRIRRAGALRHHQCRFEPPDLRTQPALLRRCVAVPHRTAGHVLPTGSAVSDDAPGRGGSAPRHAHRRADRAPLPVAW